MNMEKLIDLRSRMERVIANYVARVNEEYLEEEKGLNVVAPAADTYLDGDRQIIFLETPALDERSVELSRRDGMLLFRGLKRKPNYGERHYFHLERGTGDYLKVLPLERADEDILSVKHSYRHGVVKITVLYRSAETGSEGPA